jgi:hypothetical protein
MNVYNSKGIFGNANDTAADLERILKDNFRDYSLRMVGCYVWCYDAANPNIFLRPTRPI